MTRTARSPKGTVNKVCISLSPEATEKLERFCRKHDRPRSWVLTKLVDLYLDKLEGRQ